MKTDFSVVIFSDECRETLDGPDVWLVVESSMKIVN